MKITNEVIAAEIKAKKKLSAEAIKMSDRRSAKQIAEYLVALIKRKEA